MLSLQSDPVLTSASLQTLTTTTAMPQPSTRTVPLLLESTTSTEIKDPAQPSLQTAQITPIPTFSLFSNVDQLTEKNENHENTDKLQEDSSQKKGRPKGSQILKFVPKKVKLTGIKIERKDTTESRCSINGCIVRLSTQSDMEYHRQCHEEGGGFKCPICSHSTSQWNSMSIHLWKDHRINMDLFSCEQCTYKTNSFSKLNQHCKIHGEERPYLCDTCGKGFKTTKQLRNHKVIHRSRVRVTEEGVEVNGPLRRHFVCKICNRTFAEKRVVRQHIETVHNKMKNFLCSCCGHTASSRSALRMHIRQHTGEKPFSCEHCPYNTADHNSLRRHIMRHTGKYPYRCPHCTYACIQSTTYKTHLKNKHPGMNEGIMFDCPDCSFRTVKKDNLLSHIAEHALGADPRTRRKNYNQQTTIKIGKNIPDDPVAINEDSSPELIVADSNPT
uniref:C2H2-type domain-containing protein n=2 Tax=Clastoptera arizonana TaxID=38151 RepID=A0A1B6DZT1_9HEMI